MRTIRQALRPGRLASPAIALALLLVTVACTGAVADYTGGEEEPEPISVTAGTLIPVTLEQTVGSDDSRAGQPIEFTVREDIMVNEQVAIPAGSRIEGEVTHVQEAKRPQKPGEIVLTAHTLHVRNQIVSLNAVVSAKGRGSHEEDAKEIGIGAAAGAVLGGILEGGEGALAGVILGGGGTFLATKGEEIELPAGTPLIVELQAAVEVPSES